MLVLPKDEWADYVHQFSQKALKSESPLTCMTTMKKSQAETVDFLVIGTERGEIQIVDGQAFLMKEVGLLLSSALVILLLVCPIALHPHGYRLLWILRCGFPTLRQHPKFSDLLDQKGDEAGGEADHLHLHGYCLLHSAQ